MGREIRFRAYGTDYPREQSKHMRYDIQNHSGYGGECFGDFLDHKYWIVMQYTGLKDKNGKEIWEGDIVKVWIETNTDTEHPILMTFQVEFKNGEFRAGPRAGQRFAECEVIGNIYEHGSLFDK